MSLTKSKLKQIIKEELRSILAEKRRPTPAETAECEKCLRKIVDEVDYDFLGHGKPKKKDGTFQKDEDAEWVRERKIHWMCRGIFQSRVECGRWCKCPVLKNFNSCIGKGYRPCRAR